MFFNTISLSRHEQVCLNGPRFQRYFTHHRDGMGEVSMMGEVSLKHTCSWSYKLIVLWILNRQAKLFLLYFFFLSQPSIPLNYETFNLATSENKALLLLFGECECLWKISLQILMFLDKSIHRRLFRSLYNVLNK